MKNYSKIKTPMVFFQIMIDLIRINIVKFLWEEIRCLYFFLRYNLMFMGSKWHMSFLWQNDTSSLYTSSNGKDLTFIIGSNFYNVF